MGLDSPVHDSPDNDNSDNYLIYLSLD